MKRFWLVILSVGLVLSFSAQAFAVDVKFSGSFYAAGMYLDKVTLINNASVDEYSSTSTAFYYQRLRVQTDFIVSPGLKLVTRFDAMERIWGGARSSASTAPDYIGQYPFVSAGTQAENQNIAFDLAYIQYASPIGTFTAGYQLDDVWGTVFGDNSAPQGKIGWSMQMGGWTAMAQIVKVWERNYTAINTGAPTDVDWDKYIAGVIYNWQGGEAGARYFYSRNAIIKAPDGAVIYLNSIQPYAKAQIGPVKVQAELDYYWGDVKPENEDPNMKLESINFFLDAVADFNMFYVGGTFAYLSGDDPGTNDKIEGSNYLFIAGATSGGYDWNPCLIMWNFDRTYWASYLPGYGGVANYSPMENAWFWQIRGGVRPLAALDIMASVSYANADKKPEDVLNNAYGWEFDLTGTYKITNNLSYMMGVGYLWTGDYYKGSNGDNNLNNNYLLINKLTLTF